MDRDTAREELKGYLTEYVQSITSASRKAGRGMYTCPICGSGTGKSKTGAFSIAPDGTSWKCFACQQGGDIFDLIGKVENLTDHTAQLERASALFGVPVDSYNSTGSEYQKQAKSGQYTHKRMQSTASTHTHTAEKVDYTSFFLQAHDNIAGTDYPQQRGLSMETINRFKLGYIAEWRHPKAPATAPATPRLIIPTGRHSYLARDTRADIPAEQQQYSKQKVGSMQIFNRRALQDSPAPVFIVEGELDALSIMEAGGEAVALGSISMVRAFLEVVEQTRPEQPLIIALDNEDKPQVQEAERKLTEGLQQAGIFSYRCNPAGVWKDANEALQHDPEGLRAAVAQAVAEVQAERDREAQEAREKYLQTSAAHHLQEFQNGIKASVDTRAISTGFFYLDRALDGGLYEGLYVMGAISSLGKTTLIMQVADQIAQAGQDVLIFSLEMARSEIMAKSISRHTCQLAGERGIDTAAAKTARGITSGARYATYSPLELGLIKDAMAAYSSYAGHVFILEGVGDIGAEQIRKAVEEHIHHTGAAPVVIVDYLQILAPADPRMTDKQNTDKAVMELKRISRDYKMPVIGISSFNRANYSTKVSMEAFKESGAIEYSSDVLIGLQLKGSGEKNFDVQTAKEKSPREVELHILKNRNGKTTGKQGIQFNYYPMFNFYRELPQ